MAVAFRRRNHGSSFSGDRSASAAEGSPENAEEGTNDMAKRWQQRPEGSTWGDWGDDDELGRINLIGPEQVLKGVAEVQAGRSFCLSLPLDLPGGTALNQRRHPPRLAPTEDMDGTPDVFFNVHMSEMPDFGDPKYVDVWADDVVTLSLQYSTQWDSLAHVGAEFDADGDGVEEAVYYNGYRAGTDLVGPSADARGDGSGHASFAHHLGLEHMAAHGVQGRGVLVDLRHHLGDTWRPVGLAQLQKVMAADGVVVEEGDVLLLHTGFATKLVEWGGNPPMQELFTSCAYLDAKDDALLQWIADSGISALVADNYAVEGLLGKDREEGRHSFLPIHHLCLFKLGVPLGELWYLDELAAWLREHGRSRFLLTAPPLRLPGIVGSPVTPIATV
jgi:kynurenine formamidase